MHHLRFLVSWKNPPIAQGHPQQDPSLCELLFEVEDSGIGIAQHHLDQLFNAFEQVGDRSRQAEGTGLGLAISQRIIKMMDSEIQVKSELNAGSRFFFSLTLPITQPPFSSADIITHNQSKIIGYEGERRKILIIDDRWENRAVFRNLLEPLGFEIATAENGQLALHKLQELTPDLIILDIVMPVMDGYEFLSNIRQNSSLRHFKVVIATASASQEEITKSIAAGADDYLSKPIVSEILFTLLRKHLQLTWTYEAFPSKAESVVLTAQPWNIDALPQEIVKQLLPLAQAGRLKKLSETIQALLENQAVDPQLARHLEELIQRFDCEAIEALLEPGSVNNR